MPPIYTAPTATPNSNSTVVVHPNTVTGNELVFAGIAGAVTIIIVVGVTLLLKRRQTGESEKSSDDLDFESL
jgi:hypothetical protein